MMGRAKSFLARAGKHDLHIQKKKHDDTVGFLDLWRYASWGECGASLASAALALAAAGGLLAAVLLYGELTALFVARHRRQPPQTARLLALFGGGAPAQPDHHMDALVLDSWAFAYASLVVMALQLCAASAAVWLATRTASSLAQRLRLRLLRSLIAQEMAFFDTHASFNFASSLTEDVEKLRAGVGPHVAMTAYLGGTVVWGCALALAYGWRLALAGLAVVPVSLAVAWAVARRQTAAAAREAAAQAAAGRAAEDALAALRTVRAYAGEPVEEARYAARLRGAERAARARGAWAGAGAGLGWLLTYSINAVVFAYGSALCVRDMELPPERQEYHPGVMVTVLFCTFMAAQNVTMCQPHLEVFSAARGAARALYRLLERRSALDPLESRGARPALKGEVLFEDVHFAYPARPDVPVLRGLTLRVPAGRTVALVGPSGCGKSTLLQLLQRLYSPARGSVSVDGHRLPDLHLHHYRSSIGVVGQEPVLFSGTVRENIALGADDVSDDEVVAAARTAHAHDFITKLADGYDTVLGERGASLSGGQKQRLAIARAVLRRPALLLLDEPTSALDPAAEREVQAALDAAGAGRTTLVVSHRLHTVRRAHIVLVEDGVVREQGDHDELLARRGAYWRLVQQDGDAAAAPPEPAEKLDEPEPEASFRRARSTRSLSPHRESTRRSVRLGSATAARAPAALLAPAPERQETAEEREEEREEREEEAGDVSAWRLLALHRPEWALVAGGGLASLLLGATLPAFAFLFARLYGMFSLSDGAAILAQSRRYAALFAGVAALCGAGTFLQAWLLNAAGARLTARLRRRLFARYLRHEQAWHDRPAHAVGALCARLAADAGAVQGATGTRLGTVLHGAATMLLGAALAAAYSWKMTLVSLLGVPCVIGAIRLEGAVSRRAEAAERRALERASRVATEAVLNVRTVQSLAVERCMLARYAAALGAAGAGAAGAARARGLAYGLCLCAPTLGYTVSLACGGLLIARDGLPYESAILVAEALIYGAWMLAEALSFAPSFAAARRSGARILAALAREPAVRTEPSARAPPAHPAGGASEVELKAVHFEYPTRAHVPVLRGLSLRAPAGHTLALVGPSGCGKSTVLQLLLRNYDPRAGSLELDGRDVRRDLPLESLRASLGLVAQEPALLERTIRENIAYGDNSRDVPLDEVVRAAQQANVHSFIASLPLGYETVVSGAALSGGQKQRVCIARALVRAPRVLLLDEPTSALDAASESAVAAALAAASAGRTTLLVAHRLHTVRHAHLIAVVERGAVVESGSHDELVRRRGAYWRMLRQQEPARHPDDRSPS